MVEPSLLPQKTAFTLDTVAPLFLRKIKEKSPTPWYEHTRALKRAGRKMERSWRRTKLEVTVATRSGPYPAQMITAVNRSSPYTDQVVDHYLEMTSTALNVSGDQGT